MRSRGILTAAVSTHLAWLLAATLGAPAACNIEGVEFAHGGEAGSSADGAGAKHAGDGGRAGNGSGGKLAAAGGEGGTGPDPAGGQANGSGGRRATGGSTSDGGTPSETSGGSDAGASGGMPATGGSASGGARQDCPSCAPEVVSDVFEKLRSFTVSGAYAYVVDTSIDKEGDAYGKKLERVSLESGARSQLTLADLGDSGNQLLVQGSYVYTTLWDSSHSSQIGRVPLLSGTNVTALDGTPSYILALRANSTHVFGIWDLSQMHLTRVPLAGGTSNHPAQTPTHDWIDYEVDDDFAYLLTKSTLARVPVTADDGGGSAELGPSPMQDELFQTLALPSPDLVLIGTNQRLLRVVSFKDGKVAPIASGRSFGEVIADENFAYAFHAKDSSCTASELYEFDVKGALLPRLLLTAPGCPQGLGINSSGVYWISEDRTALLRATRN